MAEILPTQVSKFGDDSEGFLLFYEIEPLEDQDEIAERLRLLEIEESKTEGE